MNARTDLSIKAIATAVLSASHKHLLFRKPVFKSYSKVSSEEIAKLQRKVELELPKQLEEWLLAVGYGDVGEDLSFREGWFTKISKGQLTGGAIFAQDVLGSFYAFDAAGRIYYLTRHEPAFALISNDFLSFMEELVRRDYKLVEWMDTLKTSKYEW